MWKHSSIGSDLCADKVSRGAGDRRADVCDDNAAIAQDAAHLLDRFEGRQLIWHREKGTERVEQDSVVCARFGMVQMIAAVFIDRRHSQIVMQSEVLLSDLTNTRIDLDHIDLGIGK